MTRPASLHIAYPNDAIATSRDCGASVGTDGHHADESKVMVWEFAQATLRDHIPHSNRAVPGPGDRNLAVGAQRQSAKPTRVGCSPESVSVPIKRPVAKFQI
jgi:hypothetical protein